MKPLILPSLDFKIIADSVPELMIEYVVLTMMPTPLRLGAGTSCLMICPLRKKI